jgi:hypothetical protein
LAALAVVTPPSTRDKVAIINANFFDLEIFLDRIFLPILSVNNYLLTRESWQAKKSTLIKS